MNTYFLDLDALTVIRADEHGEHHDLNGGEPCTSNDELRAFIGELHSNGYFDAEVAERLAAALS